MNEKYLTFPSQTIEPGEEHLGRKGGKPLRSQALHLLVKVYILGLGVTEILTNERQVSDHIDQ